MGRLERRLFALNDEIDRIAVELRQVEAELDVHRHLDSDAQRDAAVYDSPLDREDARETNADVARFERLVETLGNRIDSLSSKRARLLEKLK